MSRMFAYDGTFEGLLTCIYHLVPLDETCTIQKESFLAQTMYEYRLIRTHEKKAALAAKAIQKISPAIQSYLYKAWLSEKENIETDILSFVKLASSIRKNPESQLFRPFVANVMASSRRCGGEAHRFLGLIRFHKAGQNAYFAEMKPDCNILPIICPHFAARFGDKDVFIRDNTQKNSGRNQKRQVGDRALK